MREGKRRVVEYKRAISHRAGPATNKRQMPPRFQNEKSTTLVVGGIGSIALLYWMRRLYSKATPPVDCSSKTVLVIGGGIGGLTAIAGLHKYNTSVKIILVEPKDHVEIYWATYRSPFEQWVREASLIPLKGLLPTTQRDSYSSPSDEIDKGKCGSGYSYC